MISLYVLLMLNLAKVECDKVYQQTVIRNPLFIVGDSEKNCQKDQSHNYEEDQYCANSFHCSVHRCECRYR
jgi:hypothetical protein